MTSAILILAVLAVIVAVVALNVWHRRDRAKMTPAEARAADRYLADETGRW